MSIDSILNIALIVLKGLVVLSILIFFHELGHFLVSKLFGVWVEEFGLGIPPKAIGKKIGETVYSLNFLPIGGFVRLHGESMTEKAEYPERAFNKKGKIVRILISLAGIVANFVLALIAFGIVYSFTGVPRETGNVRITDVVAASPAQVAGFLVGDVVRKVDKDAVSSTREFIEKVEAKRGSTIKIEVERAVSGETTTKVISVKPRSNPPEGEGPLGVLISSTEIYFAPIWQRPFVGAYYGTIEAVNTSKAVVLGLFGIAGEVSRGEVPKGTVGPAGILVLIEYVSRLGIIPLINFIGVISINLAIINLIPFPPLDGSRVLFVGIEAAFGRKMLDKAENIVQTIGFGLLLLIMIAISVREVPTIFKSGNITNFVESIVK